MDGEGEIGWFKLLLRSEDVENFGIGVGFGVGLLKTLALACALACESGSNLKLAKS